GANTRSKGGHTLPVSRTARRLGANPAPAAPQRSSPRRKTRWTRGSHRIHWLGPGAGGRCAKTKRRPATTARQHQPGSAMATRAGAPLRLVGIALLFSRAAARGEAQPEAGGPRRSGTNGPAGVSVFVPQRWGTVGVTVSNPAAHPAEVLSAHSF